VANGPNIFQMLLVSSVAICVTDGFKAEIPREYFSRNILEKMSATSRACCRARGI